MSDDTGPQYVGDSGEGRPVGNPQPTGVVVAPFGPARQQSFVDVADPDASTVAGGLAFLVENPICQEFSSGEFEQATHPVPAFPRTAVGPVRRL